MGGGDFTGTLTPNSSSRRGRQHLSVFPLPTSASGAASDFAGRGSGIPSAMDSVVHLASSAATPKFSEVHGTHTISPNALREAVTTNRDQFSVFEDELLREINLLRQNPRGYAALFEAEATIGYPYVCPDDLYFESDERVTEQFAVKPTPPKATVSERSGRGHRGGGDRSTNNTSTNTTTNNTSMEGDNDDSSTPLHPLPEKKHARPHSARSGDKGDKNSEAASSGAVSFPLCDPEPHVRPPLTVKEHGMHELNVDQLRTFFLRHQRHRMLLEKAVKDLLHQWQAADQAQHDSWAAEDAQTSKKIKRGGRKKSISNFSSDDLTRQRSNQADQLSYRYMEKLQGLMRSLCQSRDTCKRAMDGANLMLDCIRALKEAKPVGALRGSRGLKLAARDTGQHFHRDPQEIDRVFQAHNTAIEGVCARMRPSAAATRREEANFPLFDARSAADAMHYFEDLWQPSSGRSSRYRVQPDSAYHLQSYIHSLADVTQKCCNEYGYVSGEVRGVQLYASGTPRMLVMKALLGVAVPIFGFRELHPVSSRNPSTACGSPLRSNRHNDHNGNNSFSDHSSKFKNSQLATSRRIEGTVKFDDSIFNLDDEDVEQMVFDATSHTMHGEGGAGYGTAGSTPQVASLKTTTGLMFGGQFNATSPSAATFTNAEEVSENTSAGKRAALAAQRLGPLLWRDAHLLGCGWQRVVPEKPVPPYEAREVDPIPQEDSHKEVVVSTTLVVASGYEELDLIEQHKHMSLAEVRRIVRFEEGNDGVGRPIGGPSTTGAVSPGLNEEVSGDFASVAENVTMDRPAVVDLHSSLDVSLLHPKKHPIRVDASMQTAWLALHADPNRVRIIATLTGAQEPRPQSPLMNSSELVVQPSNRDPAIIVILVNVAAASAKANEGKVLIHIFECERYLTGESGFEHIGFVRLTLPYIAPTPAVIPSERSICPSPYLLNQSSSLRGTNLASPQSRIRSALSKSSQRSVGVFSGYPASAGPVSAAQETALHTELMTTAPADLLWLVEDLRLSPHPPLSALMRQAQSSVDEGFLPPLSGSGGPGLASVLPVSGGGMSTSPHPQFNLHRSSGSSVSKSCVLDSDTANKSKVLGEASLYGSSGWPLFSFEFFDRCATLLGPLTGCLTNNSEACRMTISVPHCESYLKQQIESLIEIDRELREREEEEDCMAGATDSESDADLLDNSLYRKLVLKEAPSKPPTPPPPPPPEPAATTVVKGKKGVKGKKVEEKAPPARAAKGKETAAAPHDAKNGQRNSLPILDEGKRDELLTLPPTSADLYDPSVRTHLYRLHRLCERLTQEAIVCRTMYAKAEALLTPAMTEMDGEMDKKKGKEVLRLKSEHDAIAARLEAMHQAVIRVEEVTMRVREEITARERNGIVRRARLRQIAVELEQLRAKVDRSQPLNVKLWFTGGRSGMPLMTEREDERTCLPPLLQSAEEIPAAVYDSTLTPSEAHSPYVQNPANCVPSTRLASLASHVPPRDSNVVVLQPRDSAYTLYEADFVVPEGFEGFAVLLINDQETIEWRVISSH